MWRLMLYAHWGRRIPLHSELEGGFSPSMSRAAVTQWRDIVGRGAAAGACGS